MCETFVILQIGKRWLMKPQAEKIIAEEQAGFRAERSTTEQMSNLRILCERNKMCLSITEIILLAYIFSLRNWTRQRLSSCITRMPRKGLIAIENAKCRTAVYT